MIHNKMVLCMYVRNARGTLMESDALWNEYCWSKTIFPYLKNIQGVLRKYPSLVSLTEEGTFFLGHPIYIYIYI